MGGFNGIKSSLEKALKKGQHKLVKGIKSTTFTKKATIGTRQMNL